jgi:transcriptional regulator with XRE-family HTH domain
MEPDPERVGMQLRELRVASGRKRHHVAAETGIRSRDLAAYEKGRGPIPAEHLERLAAVYDVSVDDLVPPRRGVSVDFDRRTFRISSTVRIMGEHEFTETELLREYLALLRAMRGNPPGTPVTLREDDLDRLAAALGGETHRIEARLIQLMNLTPDEAANLRARISPRNHPATGA